MIESFARCCHNTILFGGNYMGTEQKSAARLGLLFDGGAYTEVGGAITENGVSAGVITAFGKIAGRPAYAYSQYGAVGTAHAAKICRLCELAAKTGAPVVSVHDSDGALIGAPQDALSAYGRMLRRSANISGVIPQIAVVAGVCAGSGAMLATSADIVVMTENAELFLTPNTPSDAENARANGIADIVCENEEKAFAVVRKLVAMLPANNISGVPCLEYEENAGAEGINSVVDKGSAVRMGVGFGESADVAFASVKGRMVGIASVSGGKKLSADDCEKLAEFVRVCDAYSVPVISFVDTEGFEDTGDSVKSCARLANAYADATTAKITIITGKAYGSAFIAMAGKNTGSDFTFAFSDAVISPLSPEAAVEFLMHDKLKGASDVNAERKRLADEYIRNEASAAKAAAEGCIDGIISSESVRETVAQTLEALAGKRISGLPRKHTARA